MLSGYLSLSTCGRCVLNDQLDAQNANQGLGGWIRDSRDLAEIVTTVDPADVPSTWQQGWRGVIFVAWLSRVNRP